VDDVVAYDEGMLVGYRHYDAEDIAPAYAFGHGLSYTRFRFSDLRVRSGRGARAKRRGALARISVTVTNTGERRGVAVPQLYLGLPSRPGAAQPPKALKGFKRVALAPDRARRVRFELDRRALSYWNANADRWKLAKGCVRVLIGRSSRRTPLESTLAVRAPCGSAAIDVG
jgi:beta-glucosidase